MSDEKQLVVKSPLGAFHLFGSARKGAKQWQEDSFFYGSSANNRVVVAGIFDGHGGYNGLLASAVARDCLQSYIVNHQVECERWTTEQWEHNLAQLFQVMHQAIRDRFLSERSEDVPEGNGRRAADEKGIVRTANGDPVHGGSTASVAVLLRNDDGSTSVISANVGDSTSLIMPREASAKYEFLTVDHGPENKDEFMRVKQLSEDTHPIKLIYVYDKANVFRKYECPRVFLEDGRKDPTFVQNPWGNGLHPTNVRYEPAVYAVTPRSVSKDTTCIAMTRALGDFYAQQFGLTHVPSVRSRQYPANCEFTVVVASDGVWDCWKYEDFHSYVNERVAGGMQMDQLVEVALNDSIQKAVSNFGAKHYDDASMVLVHILPASS